MTWYSVHVVPDESAQFVVEEAGVNDTLRIRMERFFFTITDKQALQLASEINGFLQAKAEHIQVKPIDPDDVPF